MLLADVVTPITSGKQNRGVVAKPVLLILAVRSPAPADGVDRIAPPETAAVAAAVLIESTRELTSRFAVEPGLVRLEVSEGLERSKAAAAAATDEFVTAEPDVAVGVDPFGFTQMELQSFGIIFHADGVRIGLNCCSLDGHKRDIIGVSNVVGVAAALFALAVVIAEVLVAAVGTDIAALVESIISTVVLPLLLLLLLLTGSSVHFGGSRVHGRATTRRVFVIGGE